MGLACCAYERDRETKVSELSSTSKVRITFTGNTNEYASESTEANDMYQFQEEEPAPNV